MSLDVDALATRAVARLTGRVGRRELRELVAAAVIVGVNQILDEARELVSARRLVDALSLGRTIPVRARLSLEAEARTIAEDLARLRPKVGGNSCAGAPQEGHGSARSAPPLSSRPL